MKQLLLELLSNALHRWTFENGLIFFYDLCKIIKSILFDGRLEAGMICTNF